MNETAQRPPLADDEIDLMDLIKVLWRSRRLIAGMTVIAVVAALVFTLTRERLYESQAVFAVQAERIRVGIEGGQETNYTVGMLSTMLKSRRLAERVVRALDLARRWQLDDEAEAVRHLQEYLSVSTGGQDRVITVSFRDPDPQLARDVVAAYVDYFGEMTNEINVTADDQALAFIESRLREVEAELDRAEAELKNFMAQYRIASLDDQVRLLVSAHAELEDRIRSLNVELNAKLSYLSDRSPEVRELQSRLAEMHRQLKVLEEGGRLQQGELVDGAAAVEGIGELNYSFGLEDVPLIALELARLEREVHIQQDMYRVLRQQHEAAKIEVSRKVNIIRLIDPPAIPDRPVPSRLPLSLALAGFLGLFGSTMLAFVGEFFRSRAWDQDAVRELPFLRYFNRGA